MIPAEAQLLMMFEISRRMRHVCYWLIEQYGDKLDIVKLVERLKDGMHRVYTRSASYVSRASNARMQQEQDRWMAMGVPEKLAHNVALLVLTRAALDIVDVAAERKRDVIESARLYSKFNDELGLHWLHNSAEDLKVSGRWQSQARGHLRDEMYRLRRQLALRLITTRGKSDPREVAERWLNKHADKVAEFRATLEEMKLRNEIDFATLSVAAQELQRLISH